MDALEATIKRDFLQEATELIEDLEKLFLEYEVDPKNHATVDSIFRIMHTLKGSGMAAGFDQLSELAHAAESILSDLRSQKLSWNRDLADLLLHANDQLAQVVRLLGKDWNAQADIADVLSALREFQSPQTNLVSSGAEGFGFFDDDEQLPVQASERPSATQATMPSKRLLIVDDDEDIRALYQAEAEEIGFAVDQAPDGEAGLVLATSQDYDVIITDLRMPVLDGIGFIKALRQFNTLVPVIFSSGYADRDDVLRFISLGAYEVLDKPADMSRLKSVLHNAAHLKSVRVAAAKLSSLNFKAYIQASKIASAARTADAVEAAKALAEFEPLLDEIATLTRLLVHAPEHDEKVAA